MIHLVSCWWSVGQELALLPTCYHRSGQTEPKLKKEAFQLRFADLKSRPIKKHY